MSRQPGPPPPPSRRDRPALSLVPTPTEPREIKEPIAVPDGVGCQCICNLWVHSVCTGRAELAITGDMYSGPPIYMCQACEDSIEKLTS